jgi:CheY-like chemotaxis protein
VRHWVLWPPPGGNLRTVQELLRSAHPMNLPASRSQPRKAILVVDDDEEVRAALYAFLSPAYRVILATDGIDGCKKANEPPRPDLIIADVAMPLLDGVRMIRRIQENDALRRVPVIFFTGQMSRASLTAGLSVNPFAYLAKSTAPDVLENNVRCALISV